MEHNPVFVDRLATSNGAVCKVAAYLGMKGYSVTVDFTRLGPDRDTWKAYLDRGDLRVNGRRVEVKKRLDLEFTADKFPHKTLLVCSCSSYERARGEGDPPYAYIILDKTEKYVAVVHSFNKNNWKMKRQTDPAYKTTYDAWCVTRDQAFFDEFSKLDELLLIP